MRFTFQQSQIWEAGDPVAEYMPKIAIKVKPGPNGEQRARRKLPSPEMGRRWILVETKE